MRKDLINYLVVKQNSASSFYRETEASMFTKIKRLIGELRAKYHSWKFSRSQPKITGQKHFGSFGLLFESKDDIDNFILLEITNPPIQLNVEVLCFHGNVQQKDEYLGKIFSITSTLLKANENRRKYIETEKRLIVEFKKKSLKDPNKHIDLTLNPVELNSELDGFLSQVKAALDSLALTLKSLFGLNIDAWRKDLKRNKKSGYNIIKQLEKLPEPLKSKSVQVCDYIEKNGNWLTYLSLLRDELIHKGGLKNISPLVFEQRTKNVVPQKIFHSQTESEIVADFMTRTIKDVAQFSSNFVLMSIILKSSGGLVLVKNDKETPSRYYWGIPQTIQEKEKNTPTETGQQ